MHITSTFSTNQHWPLESWTALVRRNPQYSFLQLGLPGETAIPGAVDLRGAVPLRVAIAILKHAHSFVGVVSGFAHATNAVGTPGVVFYGPSSIATWGHPNNRNLDARASCAPCADILGPQPCPYGSPCMRAISVREVERALEAQVASRSASTGVRLASVASGSSR
jgi:ADP-heptose:LPS heptosyltransferase